MGNNCCSKRKTKGRIVLLLVGLDNAGKTRAANTLAGDSLNSPVPTVGFSVINLRYQSYNVKVFDLGGGPNIRGIWSTYFVDAHGIIFVVDSSDYSRFDEVKSVLDGLLRHDKIAGKPVLLFANKQDNKNALDEIDIIEYLNIENLVNLCKCPTLVQSCSASERNSNKLDPGIQKGYEWLMGNITKNYDTLNKRVEEDVREQERKEREEILDKIKRIKAMQKIEEDKKDEDAIESYSDYARKLNGETEDHQIPIDFPVLDYNKEDKDDSSDSSSIIFPPVYVSNIHDSALPDRPKSAVQIVKHQLQLNNSIRRTSLKSRTNKTAPMNLYGVKLPLSARERQNRFFTQKRNLRSADDCLFTISSKIPAQADHVRCNANHHGDSIELNDLVKKNHLPPLNVKNKDVPWVHKALNGDNVVNVVDID